ncbi:hypothetical protein BHE74_00019303 [Ensete ventricosum]|nr:hypothetical protein BHE74_00019303 [Ensete ventricosum]
MVGSVRGRRGTCRSHATSTSGGRAAVAGDGNRRCREKKADANVCYYYYSGSAPWRAKRRGGRRRCSRGSFAASDEDGRENPESRQASFAYFAAMMRPQTEIWMSSNLALLMLKLVGVKAQGKKNHSEYVTFFSPLDIVHRGRFIPSAMGSSYRGYLMVWLARTLGVDIAWCVQRALPCFSNDGADLGAVPRSIVMD